MPKRKMQQEFKDLIQWSASEHSELPWRHNRTLYTTLVSEIMLQQTTVATVRPKFSAFIKQFPDLSSLASCREEDLAVAWQGLGYYRRARNLFKAARYLHDDLNGDFPQRAEELIEIPGIGDYTANALLAIGMDKGTLALDANIKRILARYFAIKEEGKHLEKALKEKTPLFFEIFAQFGGRKLNEALMDLGRTSCKARKADCLTCPLYPSCATGKEGTALNFPVKTAKKENKETLDLLRFLVIEDDSILVYQKEKGEWLEGQWELPTAITSSSDSKLKQYPQSSEVEICEQKAIKTSITKYKISNRYHYSSLEQLSSTVPFYQDRECRFIPLTKALSPQSGELLSSATLKILQSL